MGRVETAERAPLEIAEIHRLAHSFARMPLGTGNPNWWQGGVHRAYEVYTDDPLFVLFRPNQSTIHVIPPTVLTTITTRYHYGPCIVGAAYFVDDWAFERVFTTEDPHTAYPEWTAQQRADILKYQFDNGMDHTMVAFAAGYPSVFGTRAELENLLAWQWYPGSGGQTSYFNADGKVFGGGWSWSP